jgi:hypothetical protein
MVGAASNRDHEIRRPPEKDLADSPESHPRLAATAPGVQVEMGEEIVACQFV